ncbi:MAG: hypothetical protein AAGB31_02260 [Bdellovibrio sp.]
MNKAKTIPFVLVALFLLSSPTLVQAAPASSDYQEVSYDDLLNELATQKQTLIRKQQDPTYNELRLHAGIGYANSFTNISSQKQNFNRHATGIQLSLGTDFTPNWYSEGIFRNYGVTTDGSEEMTLRELDLKLGYKDKLQSIWSYSLSSGLSQRFLRFTDPSRDIDVDDTTPSLVISSGVFAQVHRNLSIGAEFSTRSAVVNRTADKNSFDFALRLSTSL